MSSLLEMGCSYVGEGRRGAKGGNLHRRRVWEGWRGKAPALPYGMSTATNPSWAVARGRAAVGAVEVTVAGAVVDTGAGVTPSAPSLSGAAAASPSPAAAVQAAPAIRSGRTRVPEASSPPPPSSGGCADATGNCPRLASVRRALGTQSPAEWTVSKSRPV